MTERSVEISGPKAEIVFKFVESLTGLVVRATSLVGSKIDLIDAQTTQVQLETEASSELKYKELKAQVELAELKARKLKAEEAIAAHELRKSELATARSKLNSERRRYDNMNRTRVPPLPKLLPQVAAGTQEQNGAAEVTTFQKVENPQRRDVKRRGGFSNDMLKTELNNKVQAST